MRPHSNPRIHPIETNLHTCSPRPSPAGSQLQFIAINHPLQFMMFEKTDCVGSQGKNTEQTFDAPNRILQTNTTTKQL